LKVRVLNGNCLDVLSELPEQSVNTCITSPPYYGLRDYGTAEWKGGDENCEHTISHYSDNLKPEVDRPFRGNRSACIKCGAIRKDSQLGLEETPEEYVENIVAVFREVRKVLRDDGTVWLNLGDSYASQGGGQVEQTLRGDENIVNSHQLGKKGVGTSRNPPKNYKQKDLMGIPWMVAFALRADGWYLRQDIIWHKPNPMPESVKDRCTKAHEYIFLLTKNKKYYYDNDAIREPHTWEESKPRPSGMERNAQKYRSKVNYGGGGSGFAGHSGSLKADGTSLNHPDGRNKRSVWTVTTKPFKDAHFATFPPELIKPCILAGCPEDGTVLDPFGGSGTTGVVANRYGRNAILIELNDEYAEMSRNRIYNDSPLFVDVE
jgi:DNA modification methylase